MIQEPLFIGLILFAVVIGAQKWHEKFQNAPIMRYIPTPVLCYIPPTLLTTAGILPIESTVYTWVSHYVLPACLILLLMTTDIKGLLRVGKPAITAMLLATSSVIIGGVVVFLVAQNQIGDEAWAAVGTMTGSLIGGTVNMIAVKEATGLSEQILTPLFISDITIVYVWMTSIMILSVHQSKFDRFLRAKRSELTKALADAGVKGSQKKKMSMQSLVYLLILGFGLAFLVRWLGYELPELGTAFTHATWMIVLVTTLGLVLSTTTLRRDEGVHATKIGYFLLYLVLAATGAQANLLAILQAPIFLALGFLWLAIHAVVLIVGGRIFRIPSALLATASQANLGGVASAPVVASTYEPKLVPVALILAIFGNAAGNYLGILTAQLLYQFGG